MTMFQFLHKPAVAQAAKTSVDSEWSDVMVLALWNHELSDALSIAVKSIRHRSHRPRVVFAELANAARPISSALHQRLHADSITVVPVSSRFHQASDEDGELRNAVIARLREESRLNEMAAETVPPVVDGKAAAAVDQAFKNLPKSDSSKRREFLDDHNGTGLTDDGVR